MHEVFIHLSLMSANVVLTAKKAGIQVWQYKSWDEVFGKAGVSYATTDAEGTIPNRGRVGEDQRHLLGRSLRCFASEGRYDSRVPLPRANGTRKKSKPMAVLCVRGSGPLTIWRQKLTLRATLILDGWYEYFRQMRYGLFASVIRGSGLS